MVMMKFEGPSIGVHHDTAPPLVLQKPRMSMSDRFAARIAEQGGSKDVVDASVNTAEDDRVAEQIRAINEKTAVASMSSAESIPVAAVEVPVEAAPEAAVEAAPEKSAEQLAAEDKAMREKAMVRAAEIRRAKITKIQTQEKLVTARSVLMKMADAVPMVTKMERPPMPSIDQMQKIEIPGFGEAMVLSVDPDSQVMYFATPAERSKVDAMLVKDEGMSSMKAANFENVIAVTPDQARQYIAAANAKRQFFTSEGTIPSEEVAANTPNHLENRYSVAA
ncbi:MAG: hypothetical protein AAB473_00460 [Patescibacteria group bacterium]